MNSKKAEALLEKYWEGSSSRKEELELKSFFTTKEGASHKDAGFFHYLNNKKEDAPLDESFDDQIIRSVQTNTQPARSMGFKLWYMAAAIALLLTVGIILTNTNTSEDTVPTEVVMVDTYDDPQKAFEETKKALLFLSSKLNQSSEYAAQLLKFEQSQEIIKQN
jgi:hypothetical protein